MTIPCKSLPFAVAAAVLGFTGAAVAEPLLDGVVDSTFASNGSATIPFDLAINSPLDVLQDTVVDGEGRIYLVGMAYTVDGPRIGVVRLKKDGTLDDSYGPGTYGPGRTVTPQLGVAIGYAGAAAALDADGNLIVGGTRAAGGNENFVVCKLDANGVAADFPNGFSCVTVAFDLGGDNKDTLRDIAVQPNGKIVMVGSVAVSATFAAGGVARLDANGDPDTSFNSTGKRIFLPDDTQEINLNAVAIMQNGRIIAVGDSTLTGATDRDLLVARINADGAMDANFDDDGVRTYAPFGLNREQTLNEVVVLPPPPGPFLFDQSIIAVGAIETGLGSGLYEGLVAQFDGNGDPAGSFNGNGYVLDIQDIDVKFNDVVREPDGKILVAGTIKPGAAQQTQYYVTRFTAAGARDDEGFNAPAGRVSYGFIPSSNDVGTAIALQNNRIIVAGSTLISSNPANLDFSVIGLVRDQIFADGVD